MTRTNAKERMASILADLKAIQKERDSMIIDCGGYGKYPKTMVAIDGRISSSFLFLWAIVVAVLGPSCFGSTA